MKAQMSLEVLVYVLLAGVSLVYSISLVSGYYASSARAASSYEYSNFVEAINMALMNGASAVSLYVPNGVCNSTETRDSIAVANDTLYFAEPVSIRRSLLCKTGTAEANITQRSGYFEVG